MRKTKIHKKLHKLKPRRRSHKALVTLLVISLIAGVGSYFVSGSRAADPHTPFKYKVASYNILGAGANTAPEFNKKHHTNTRERMKDATSVMQGFDIIGVQELDYFKEPRFDKNQFTMFKNELNDKYDLYPATSPTSTKRALKFDKESMRAIFWKKSRFNLVDKGSLRYPYQDAPQRPNGSFEMNDKAPWVLLQDKDNPKVKFYVLNIHMIAYNTDNCRWDCNPPNEKGGTDKAGDKKRKEAGQILRSWVIQSKKKHPVLVTGDFNSGFTMRKNQDHREASKIDRGNGLPYCILTSDGLMRNTRDAWLNRKGACPTNNKDEWLIDHVYATQAFTVERWGKFGSDRAKKASDHRPIFAVVTVNPPATNQPDLNDGSDYPETTAKTSEDYSYDSLELLDD